jgi:hypothetical protein
MFFYIVVVVHSFKRCLLESISCFWIYSRCIPFGAIMLVIYAVHKDADVVLLSVLLYMLHWCVGSFHALTLVMLLNNFFV